MAREGGADLLRLHAIAPHLSTDELLRGVSRVLGGSGSRLGAWRPGRYGQVLRHDGVTAEVVGSWDGPELRLRCGSDPAHASRAGDLLTDIAAATGDARRDSRPAARPPARHSTDHGRSRRGPNGRGPGENGPSEHGYRAWQAMMRHWCIPESALAEVRSPGRLGPVDWLFPEPPSALDSMPSDSAPGTQEAAHAEPLTFIFDHVGPPEPPPGWLLRSWFSPDAGTFHCSVQPAPSGRLRVRTPHSADRERAAAFLSAWRTLTVELAARPGLPLSALSVPPRVFVLARRPLA
ncbi:hypothetical protein [Streptomyces sp. H27-D2]|uniref:hypothetical protein n=1 Tax=Streptomyces sp. H27-D2 TaxID=3046304 RepID=UPI002DBDF852|nr:hypothetical protein [Streptomyces sp. H27-D2]MEC4019655.1 hypothetical protein [Streptomyces sp. H27-D2]